MVLNIITIIALFIGPTAAVLISLWLQRRHQKFDAKNRVFITLMAHRKANPPHPDAVNALNIIDVVFADNGKIVGLWHQYYDLLSQTPVNWPIAFHKYIDLISAMAQSLGYISLAQTDIDKFYQPQSHVDLAQLQLKTFQAFSRVLENTEHFLVEKKSDEEKAM